MQLTKDMENKVRRALLQYSEYQVANMYGLRVATVRAVKVQMAYEGQTSIDKLYDELLAPKRKQETPLEMGLRLQEDLFKESNRQLAKAHKTLSDADYAGLEARVLSGFFTPNGQPTPAFWGFIGRYVKKSGHTMLDILHDKEIYAPEQLERALDIDSQLEDMTQEQAIALMRRVAAKVYANAFKDPSGSGADVQDSE